MTDVIQISHFIFVQNLLTMKKKQKQNTQIGTKNKYNQTYHPPPPPPPVFSYVLIITSI